MKNGLDPAVLSEVMKQSSGGNWALNLYNPWPGVMPQAPASNGYAGGFQVRLMNKDLGLALANAQAVQASTPLGALARNLFSLHAQADAEHEGWTSPASRSSTAARTDPYDQRLMAGARRPPIPKAHSLLHP